MPIVPRIDAPQVAPAGPSSARFDAPQAQNYAAQQGVQMGRSMEAAGGEIARLEAEAQAQANQLRVTDALNKVKEAQLRMTYDKDQGYSALKGIQALERPDGKPLHMEYGDALNKHIGEVGASLGNDAQRQLFDAHAKDMLTSFVGQVQGHEQQEFKNYGLSVSEGVQATARRDIALNWNNPDATDQAILRIKSEAYRQGQLLGKSAEWQDAAARKLTSDGHKIAMLTALENNNPAYADTYLKKYAGQMEADDIMAVRGHITKQMDAQIASGAASDVVREFVPKLAPTDFDRLINITMATESNGQRYGKGGGLLTSPKGARGEMQVMPATAKNPGFGVKPIQDDSPDEFARVGRDLLGALLKHYDGDPAKAWAAYNAGSGRLDAALKAAGRPVLTEANDPNAPNPNNVPISKRIDWLSLMPKETQAYVAKNMAALSGGQGTPQRPTLADAEAQLAGNPEIASNPARLKLAREELARQWKVQEDAIKQRGEDATAEAMRQLIGNGGHFNDLTASVRGAIPPKEVDNVLNFAARVAKGEDITNPLLYARLAAHPEELARMSDAQFFMLRRELSESDSKHFANERAKQLGNAPGANGPGDLNSGAIKQTLDARMRVLGMDPTPKDDGGADAARIGAVRQFVDQYFVAAQREAGKKFTDAEVAQHIDALFAKNATFRGWIYDKSGPVLGMKIGDIDGAAKDNIKAAFKRRGVDSPTDAQIMNAYWNMKFARK